MARSGKTKVSTQPKTNRASLGFEEKLRVMNSRAHHGGLFFDELLRIDGKPLEVLRQPTEDGYVSISRTKMSATYPDQFAPVCALNPCPCPSTVKPDEDRGQFGRCSVARYIASHSRGQK